MKHPFRYFNSSPEIIRLAVMMYVRYPLSLRQVEDLLFPDPSPAFGTQLVFLLITVHCTAFVAF